MKRTSAVIGASGQVGEHCLAALKRVDEMTTYGTYAHHARPDLLPLDVTDAEQFERFVGQARPDVIYFAASIANVDTCEQHPDETYVTNVLGVHNAVQAANRFGCKLVYLSSEYLFDGTAGPYDEPAATKPLCVYGWQKLAAEHFIAAFASNWLIVRTAVVYSWESQGKNFLYRLRGRLLQGEPIDVPVDQVSTPTYAPDLVQAMIDLAERKESGVFNICGRVAASRYQFAVAAAELFGLDPTLVKPVLTADLHQPARRPLNAGLTVHKTERVLGRPMLDYSAGLREMARRIPGN